MSNNQFTEQYWLKTYDLSPRKVTRFLLSIIALLVIFNLLEQALVSWLNSQENGQFVSIYFNFDLEGNLPSFYSALALGFCGYLLNTIATVKKKIRDRYAKHWKSLAFIFLYLAIDEACSIHELLIPIMKNIVDAQGWLYFPWVIPAFFLIIMLLLIFRKFLLSLPKKTRNLFLLSGVIYVGGALGMEMISGYIADSQGYNTIYGLASSIEELLEMFGVVIFINALLSYIQSKTSKLGLSISFQQPQINNWRS